MSSLTDLQFQNYFTSTFAGDTTNDLSSRSTPQVLYALAKPTPVKNPKILAWSHDLAKRFNLDQPETQGETAALLTGNLVTLSMKPYAACYGGHQFGHWADQLGDGRAITLGELTEASSGERYDLQLKGAGRTAYSRRADGRAVLRSSLREYIASEALHFLGVPTTRALSLSLTGDQVLRDMFYDGHAKEEPGAIVARVAPSFIRFGNFEILAARGENENLQKLIDYVIEHYYKTISLKDPNRVHLLFDAVANRTASLMAHWMRVGFVHGVMNTDNMSILGLTIDYGPYGFLDNYDPMFTPNTTDLPGRRYCYGRQPKIAQWNLARLAEAFLVLVPDQIEKFQSSIEQFEINFQNEHLEVMGNKLGLGLKKSVEDLKWLNDLEKLMLESQADFTHFYRLLTDTAETTIENLQSVFYQKSISTETKNLWSVWLTEYNARTLASPLSSTERKIKMSSANPIYVPRNFILQEIIDGIENNNTSLLEHFSKVLQEPYVHHAGAEIFLRMRPDWALDKAGCSTLSCSS